MMRKRKFFILILVGAALLSGLILGCPNDKDDTEGEKACFVPTTKQELKEYIEGELSSQGDTADLNCIDTSNITDMSELFKDQKDFNGKVDKWDVSNVADMYQMFNGASVFDQDLSGWDVSDDTNMAWIFVDSGLAGSEPEWYQSICIEYYSPVDQSTLRRIMLKEQKHQKNRDEVDLSCIDTSTIDEMSGLFTYNVSFNAKIGKWDVSNVKHMDSMFFGATKFNQDIGGWDVSNVTDMSQIFYGAAAFNQDIEGWDVNNVTDMSQMFYNAGAFNQDIGGWDVNDVTDMSQMFYNAAAFNQNLDAWADKVAQVTDVTDMFLGSGIASGDEPEWYKGK